jgi:RNA polymerase sigma factor (sigma-70 family)
MSKEAKKFDLDLAQMTDEALVILVQECTFQPAADELVLRYYERMNQLIAVRLRQRWFTADVPDAQQNGVFAILEAIAGYDTREVAKPRGCSFRTYVSMVVLARLRDFVKYVHRVERRFYRLEASGDSPVDDRGRCSGSRRSDPVELLVRKEDMARLHRILDRLGDTMRRLWQELANGKKLTHIAREQGVSYDRMKRQRRRLLAQLAAQLRNVGGD